MIYKTPKSFYSINMISYFSVHIWCAKYYNQVSKMKIFFSVLYIMTVGNDWERELLVKYMSRLVTHTYIITDYWNHHHHHSKYFYNLQCALLCREGLQTQLVSHLMQIYVVASWQSYRNGKPESSVICQYVCQSVLFVQPIRSLIWLVC